MKKRITIIIMFLILTLLMGGLNLDNAMARQGDYVKKLKNDIDSTRSLNTLVLEESSDLADWTIVPGDGTGEFHTVTLDPANLYEYLDVYSLTADPGLAAGDYGFFLDVNRVPDEFYSYWAGKGVDEEASTPLSYMWQIINGEAPMFYLRVAGSSYNLIDGFKYLADGSTTTEKFRVNGDLPLFTYNFGGTLNYIGGGSEYLVLGITFTKQAIVSISGKSFVIDGCGYVDLFIHVSNVTDLYAMDISLRFEEEMIEIVDLLDESNDPDYPLGVNLLPIDDWFNAGYWVNNQAYNNAEGEHAAGTIEYMATQLNTTTPATGEGNVAQIRLRAKAAGISEIAIEHAMLSDRDGYLMGIPAVLDSKTITTQFTTSGGLNLEIERLDAANVQLSWPKQALDDGARYTLYKHNLAYFNIGDPGVQQITGLFTDAGTTLTYSDPVLGDVVKNYFYSLQVTCENGLMSPASWQVGKFEFTLYETTGTDYSLIGLNLILENVTNTTELASHIEGNSNIPITVISVSKWNGTAQQFQAYTPDEPSPIQVKQPYQVEVEVTGSANRAIWAQVGRLPIKTINTYTLRETTGTDYTWILQPLYMTSITDTNGLITSVQSLSSGGVTVISVSKWNGVAQQFEGYDPGDPSSTRFGYPYQVEVDITEGITVTWPTVLN
jgi:hypothetical protein